MFSGGCFIEATVTSKFVLCEIMTSFFGSFNIEYLETVDVY